VNIIFENTSPGNSVFKSVVATPPYGVTLSNVRLSSNGPVVPTACPTSILNEPVPAGSICLANLAGTKQGQSLTVYADASIDNTAACHATEYQGQALTGNSWGGTAFAASPTSNIDKAPAYVGCETGTIACGGAFTKVNGNVLVTRNPVTADGTPCSGDPLIFGVSDTTRSSNAHNKMNVHWVAENAAFVYTVTWDLVVATPMWQNAVPLLGWELVDPDDPASAVAYAPGQFCEGGSDPMPIVSPAYVAVGYTAGDKVQMCILSQQAMQAGHDAMGNLLIQYITTILDYADGWGQWP
jgi:hypothetical protein